MKRYLVFLVLFLAVPPLVVGLVTAAGYLAAKASAVLLPLLGQFAQFALLYAVLAAGFALIATMATTTRR